MQLFHQSHYGHVGGAHTMKPVFVQRGDHLYKGSGHAEYDASKGMTEEAMFHVKNGKLYASIGHEDHGNPHALYEIRGDKVFTTHAHSEYVPGKHEFVVGPEQMEASAIEKIIQQG